MDGLVFLPLKKTKEQASTGDLSWWKSCHFNTPVSLARIPLNTAPLAVANYLELGFSGWSGWPVLNMIPISNDIQWPSNFFSFLVSTCDGLLNRWICYINTKDLEIYVHVYTRLFLKYTHAKLSLTWMSSGCACLCVHPWWSFCLCSWLQRPRQWSTGSWTSPSSCPLTSMEET